MSLTPDPNIQKILISSTAHFVGEYATDEMRLSHAWPSAGNFRRLSEGPTSRSAFILTFRTEPPDNNVVLPSYQGVGEVICSYLAVLYGKRFDFHGVTESLGFFNVPDLGVYNQLCNPLLPHNRHASRPDFGIPLQLGEVRRLERVFAGEDSHEQVAFRTGAKFYLQALQAFDEDAEVAYLHLITAGEIIAGAMVFDTETLLDPKVAALLQRVERELPDGEKAARLLKSKMLGIKRRFVRTFETLVDAEFFSRSESAHTFARLKSEDFSRRMGAAYDLRSRYVHTGRSFGIWISRIALDAEEIQLGQPVIQDDKEFGKILALAPTFIGLERVVRYSLLRLGERCGIDLSPSPTDIPSDSVS